jgi:hypothetical protein
VWGLLKRWYYFILAGLLEPFDVLGRVLSIFSEKPINLPPKFFAAFLGIGFLCAIVHTYHTLRMEKLASDQRFQRATSKRLELVFEAGEPFEQAQQILDSNNNRGTVRTFRVGVKNAGGTTINRAELDLESISPPTLVKCPVPLHIMHDNPSGRTPHRSDFSLDAGQVEYVDVVVKGEWSIARGHPIEISHTVQGVPRTIDAGRYQLTLFAHGEGASPIRRTFVVEVDAHERLVFRPE